MPDALLFDLDGVLADVSGSFRRSVIETAATYGVALTADLVQARKAAGGANNDWVLTHSLLAAHGIHAPLPEVTMRFESIYQGTNESPGLRRTERCLIEVKVWNRFAERLPLAVVTGRTPECALRFLEEHGLAEGLSVLVGMGDAPAKPDPAPVRLALRRLGVQKAWMIGDNPDDMRAARGAEVVALGIIAPGDDTSLMTKALMGAGAHRILRDLEELNDLLEAGRSE